MPAVRRPVWLGIVVLTCEKILQHASTAVALTVDIPRVGSPDLGRAVVLGEPAVAILNLALAVLFGIGLHATLHDRSWNRPLLAGLAGFDIVAELVLHAGVLITLSVVVAVALLVLFGLDARTGNGLDGATS